MKICTGHERKKRDDGWKGTLMQQMFSQTLFEDDGLWQGIWYLDISDNGGMQ